MLQLPEITREKLIDMLLHGRSVFETSQMIQHLQQLPPVKEQQDDRRTEDKP